MRSLRRFFILLFATFRLCDQDPRVVDLSQYFEEAGYVGSFVLYDSSKDLTFVSDEAGPDRPRLPASTFKIFNSLVALETGAVADEKEVIRWDGKHRTLPAWNQDHTLKSAIQFSVVWFYQELARRAGPEKMKSFLEQAEYGNGDLSAGIDSFWLEGPFRVTMYDQIELLKNLHNGDLPFSRRNLNIVKSILIVEETPEYTLRAKTGLAIRSTPCIGWWVGYAVTKDGVYYFATIIETDTEAEAMSPKFIRARKSITRKILTHLEVL